MLRQSRSRRSSDLVVLYLLATVACDAVYLAMPSGVQQNTKYLAAVLFRCCSHSFLLGIECCGHRHTDAFGQVQPQTAEDERNILARAFFTWINPILLQGYKTVLDIDQLPRLCKYMRAESTRQRMIQAWSHRGKYTTTALISYVLTILAKPETKMTLPWALLKCLNHKFYHVIPSRLFLIVFRYSQPILIRETITFSAEYSADERSNRGYWLIVSAITLYTGLAVSCLRCYRLSAGPKLTPFSAVDVNIPQSTKQAKTHDEECAHRDYSPQNDAITKCSLRKWRGHDPHEHRYGRFR